MSEASTPFVYPDDEKPSQAHAAMQLSVDLATQLIAIAGGWVSRGRNGHAVKVRAAALEIAFGRNHNVSETAKQLGISRQSLHRTIAACKGYTAQEMARTTAKSDSAGLGK